MSERAEQVALFRRNQPTANQRRWITALREQGRRVEVCYSANEAAEIILNYLEKNV